MSDWSRLLLDELAGDPAALDRLAGLLADRMATCAQPDPTSAALLTVSSAARLLGCSTRTVRRRIAERKLPAVVEHGRTMLRSDELQSYVERLERLNAPAPGRRRASTTAVRYDSLR